MYRALLDVSFICLLVQSLSAEDAKTAALESGLPSNEHPFDEHQSENEMSDEIEQTSDDESDELAMRKEFSEYDDPAIAEYLANRFPRMGGKARRMKRYLPFANDDIGNFLRFSPDENIKDYLRDQPSLDDNDDGSESIESTGEDADFVNEHTDQDNDYGSLDDELMKGNHPGMRRLHQYYDDDDIDEDEDIDEEKLFANQFPSLEEMKAKGRFDMDELYQKLAQHKPGGPRPQGHRHGHGVRP